MQDICLTFPSNRILAWIVLRAAKGAGVGSGGAPVSASPAGRGNSSQFNRMWRTFKKPEKQNTVLCLSPPTFHDPFRHTAIFESARGDIHWTISVQFLSCCVVFAVVSSRSLKVLPLQNPKCSFRLANFHTCPCPSPLCLTAPVVLPPRLCVCESVSVCVRMHA